MNSLHPASQTPPVSLNCQSCGGELVDGSRYCPVCGRVAGARRNARFAPAAHKNARHGPRASVWPPVPQTLWWPDELVRSEPPDSAAPFGFYVTPRFQLQQGQYDIGAFFPHSPPRGTVKLWCSHENCTATRYPYRLGTHLAHDCLRITVGEQPQWVRLGVEAEGESLTVGIILIPRLGALWTGEQLDHTQLVADNVPYGSRGHMGAWLVCAEGVQPGREIVRGPNVPLPTGDFVAVFRLVCGTYLYDDDQTEIVDLDVYAPDIERHLASATIPRGQWGAGPTTLDIPLSFHVGPPLNAPGDGHSTGRDQSCRVEFRVRAQVKVDIEVAHVRVLTLDDAIEERYYELGGQGSMLGLPVGAPYTAEPSRVGTSGKLRRYEGGSIYCNSSGRAHETCGLIGDFYEESGGSNESFLGFPVFYSVQATSRFGTIAQCQSFECNGAHPADVFASHWGVFALGRYSGLVSAYYREGGWEGELGLPVSEERIEDSADKCLAQANFEGGTIKYDTILRGDRVEFYPRPRLSVTCASETVVQGDSLRIRLEAINAGGDAEEGYLCISLPDPVEGSIEALADVANYYVHYSGHSATSEYGCGRTVLAYPRPEACIAPWRAGESHWLEISVRPTTPGEFRIYARAVAGPIPKYEAKYGYKFEGDPLPLSEGLRDQQDERVYERKVTVLERLLPDLVIEKVELPTLIFRYNRKATLTVCNRGRGVALDVVANASSELGGRRSKNAVQIDAGERKSIEIPIRPEELGSCDAQFTLTGSDQYGATFSVAAEASVEVVSDAALSSSNINVVDSVVIIRRNEAKASGEA